MHFVVLPFKSNMPVASNGALHPIRAVPLTKFALLKGTFYISWTKIVSNNKALCSLWKVAFHMETISIFVPLYVSCSLYLCTRCSETVFTNEMVITQSNVVGLMFKFNIFTFSCHISNFILNPEIWLFWYYYTIIDVKI